MNVTLHRRRQSLENSGLNSHDRHVNFNEIGLTSIENEDYYQFQRFYLDITPNSDDYPTKNSMALVGRINFSFVRLRGLHGI